MAATTTTVGFSISPSPPAYESASLDRARRWGNRSNCLKSSSKESSNLKKLQETSRNFKKNDSKSIAPFHKFIQIISSLIDYMKLQIVGNYIQYNKARMYESSVGSLPWKASGDSERKWQSSWTHLQVEEPTLSSTAISIRTCMSQTTNFSIEFNE